MTLHRLIPASPVVRAFDARQRGDLSRNLDALLKGAPSGMALGVMIEKLKDMLGNSDLSETLDDIEAIYSAEPGTHFSAARCLRNASAGVRDDHGIEY